MSPEHIEIVGGFLALRWPDGREDALPLEQLRRRCPCARCAGEGDLLGRVRFPGGGAPALDPERSFELVEMSRVGHYALSLGWADGHDTGIWSWTALRQLGEELDATG